MSPLRAFRYPMAVLRRPFRALRRHRNFRLFWTGQTVSLIGTWMQSVAQGWLALELTDDPFMVGLVTAMQSLPVMLFSLGAGVLADRTSKLRLVIIAQSLLLVVAIALWWFTWSGHITIGWLLALAFAGGVFNALDIPARQALIIELVGRDDLLDAIALNSSGFNLARIIGPAIAGIVIASLGLAWCFGINAISYFAVLLGLFLIRLPRWEPRAQPLTALEGFRQGIAYMRSTREVAGVMRLVAAYSILGIPYLTLMPVFARETLGLGATGYSYLLTSVGVGALAGALTLAAIGRTVRRGRLLTLSSLSFAALIIVLPLLRHPLLAAGLLVIIGTAMIVTNALFNGILQSIIPDHFRGRVMAAYTFVFVGLGPIGSLLSGAVARWAGVELAIAGAAVLLLLYAARALSQHPEIRRL